MQIDKNVHIVDLALLIESNLVICDVHIGYEEYLNKIGVFVPRFQFKEIIKRLEKIFIQLNKKYKLKKLNKIIINGDIKHEFGTISEQEWRHTLRLIDFFKKYCDEVILIKGNHDTIIGPIANKRGVTVKDYFKLRDVLILHGDKIPRNSILKGINTILVGHEHPAVGLRDAGNTEIYKCFLKGKWKSKDLIVQPSFNLVTEGTDVLKEKLLSPFLTDISNFEVFVVEDKVYRFGILKDIPKNL